MVGFNIRVEIGQIVALAVFLVVFLVIILLWRRNGSFEPRPSVAANGLILTAGFMLIEYQLAVCFGVGST